MARVARLDALARGGPDGGVSEFKQSDDHWYSGLRRRGTCSMSRVRTRYVQLGWPGGGTRRPERRPPVESRAMGSRSAPRKSFEDASAYTALWVPGGDPNALARLMGDPSRVYLDFLIRKSVAVKYVCSVCEGALLLAAAGLLDGYEATTHWAFIPCLERTVQTGGRSLMVIRGIFATANRLTSGGGSRRGWMKALKLIMLLLGRKAAEDVQRTTQYYPKPPVSSEITPATECPVPKVIIHPPEWGRTSITIDGLACSPAPPATILPAWTMKADTMPTPKTRLPAAHARADHGGQARRGLAAGPRRAGGGLGVRLWDLGR